MHRAFTVFSGFGATLKLQRSHRLSDHRFDSGLAGRILAYVCDLQHSTSIYSTFGAARTSHRINHWRDESHNNFVLRHLHITNAHLLLHYRRDKNIYKAVMYVTLD
jgi:hypothetical protein